MINTFSDSLPVHSHVARPSTEEEQVAALVASGKITTSTLWKTCGATPYNSEVVFKAQAEIIAAEEAAAAAKEEESAREKAEAEAITVRLKAAVPATAPIARREGVRATLHSRPHARRAAPLTPHARRAAPSRHIGV